MANCLWYLLKFIALAGWNANNVSKGVTERDRNAIMAKTQTTLKNIVNKVCLHDAAWPFKEPVDRSQVRPNC